MPDPIQPLDPPTPRGFVCAVALLAAFGAAQVWLWFAATASFPHPATFARPATSASSPPSEFSASPTEASDPNPASIGSAALATTGSSRESGIPAIPPALEADRQFQESSSDATDPTDPSFPPPAPPVPDLVELSRPPYPPIKDLAVVKHMALAADLDHAGDMLGAIRNLRAAEAGFPGHPEILYQLGSAYLRIGNTARGYSYLNQLLALGPARAGELALLAKVKLEGGQPDHSGPRITSGPFRIGEALTRHLPAETGERVSLLVSIRTHPSAEVVPEDLQIYVHFYELTGGRQIVHSPVEPAHAWRTAPVDWKDTAEELLEFTYSRADTSADPGSSKEYYGHVIKLYYADELQDIVVQPRVLYERLRNDSRPAIEDPHSTALEDNPLFEIDEEP